MWRKTLPSGPTTFPPDEAVVFLSLGSGLVNHKCFRASHLTVGRLLSSWAYRGRPSFSIYGLLVTCAESGQMLSGIGKAISTKNPAIRQQDWRPSVYSLIV
jgi:hypothetical protein